MHSVIAALRFEPVLPWWLVAALGGLVVAACGFGFYRRARGIAWRTAGFVVLIAWLCGPVLVRETRQGLADIALLLVDRSASMQVGDRLTLADAALRDIGRQAGLLPGLEWRLVVVPESGHDGTRLWTAARQALADIPADRLAGIVAITDGQVHDLPADLSGVTAPVHLLVPAVGEQWDRRVRVVQAPSYGIVGHSVTLKVVVEDLGVGGPAGPAILAFRRDGEIPVRQSVPVGEVQTLSIDIARAGPSVIEFSTDPVAGEASALNDRAVVEINGVRDRLRVLLVSGEPNQDERTWRRLLKSDPAVDLVHFTILRPPEKDDTTPLNELALIAFPTRELFQDKLSGFDLIILDRFTDRGILPPLYLRNIADYVRRGGALLLTVGPEFATPGSLDQTPLADVLPAHAPMSGEGVITGAFRPRVTELGARHPVTENLPGANTGEADEPGWGPWYRAIAAEAVQGQVLMTGPEGAKLLILNRVDQGRAAVLMSDQIWLWSRGHGGGGPQAELLRRVAHWLMKEPELDEERFSAAIEAGRLLVERRSIAGDAVVPATVTPPDGVAAKLKLAPAGPGRATAEMAAQAPGVWQVGDGVHVAFAVAGQENRLEFADLRATAERMQGVVDRSGGGVVWLGAKGPPSLRRVGPGETAAGPGWIGLRANGAHLVTGVATTPLLPPWLGLPLLLGFLLAGWRQEGK